jgi:hypothetical protein
MWNNIPARTRLLYTRQLRAALRLCRSVLMHCTSRESREDAGDGWCGTDRADTRHYRSCVSRTAYPPDSAATRRRDESTARPPLDRPLKASLHSHRRQSSLPACVCHATCCVRPFVDDPRKRVSAHKCPDAQVTARYYSRMVIAHLAVLICNEGMSKMRPSLSVRSCEYRRAGLTHCRRAIQDEQSGTPMTQRAGIPRT